jgi:hypothetical protein
LCLITCHGIAELRTPCAPHCLFFLLSTVLTLFYTIDRRATGSLLIFAPPRCPHLNPIEKFWDIVIAGLHNRSQEVQLGLHGAARQPNSADLDWVLQNARMTRHCLEECGFHWH